MCGRTACRQDLASVAQAFAKLERPNDVFADASRFCSVLVCKKSVYDVREFGDESFSSSDLFLLASCS